MWLWNLLRALSFIECSTLIAMSWRVWRVYYARFEQAHRTGASDRRRGVRGFLRGPMRAPWIGLLPAHVWKLGTGVSGMALALLTFAVERVGREPYFNGIPLIVTIVAVGVVIWGLRDALEYEERLIGPRNEL